MKRISFLITALLSGAVLVTGCNVGSDSRSMVAARQFETDTRELSRDGLPGLNPILSSAPPTCQPDNYQPVLVDVEVPAPTENDPDATEIVQQVPPGMVDYRDYPLCADVRSAGYNADGLTTWIDATVFVPEHRRGAKLPVIVHSHGWGGRKLDRLAVSAECARPGANRETCPLPPGAGGGLAGMFSAVDAVLGALWMDGYIVVSFTQRGWGNSEGEVMIMNPYHETQDAIAVLDWIAEMGRQGHLPVAVDANGDFPLALMGGSYGGGYQFPLAALDTRADALVATGTWHSLNQSLTPNGSVKGGYGSLLCVLGGTGRQHPYLQEACQGISPLGGTLAALLSNLMPVVNEVFGEAVSLNDLMGLISAVDLEALLAGDSDVDLGGLINLDDLDLGALLSGDLMDLLFPLFTPLILETDFFSNPLVSGLAGGLLPATPALNRFADQLDPDGTKLDFLAMNGLAYFQGLEENGESFRDQDQPFAMRPLDVLLIQGMPDTLFPLQEAVNNYRYLSGKGGDVRLLTNQGGHMNFIQGQQEGSRDCGAIDTVQAVRVWINAKVRGQGAMPDYTSIPQVCLSLDDDTALALDGVPGVEESLEAQLTGGLGFPVVNFATAIEYRALNEELVSTVCPPEAPVQSDRSGGFLRPRVATCLTEAGDLLGDLADVGQEVRQPNPDYLARASVQCEPLYDVQGHEVLAGVPVIEGLQVTANPGISARQQAQIGLCVRRGDEVILVDEQLNGFDSQASYDTPVELVGVGFALQPGDQVGLYATAASEFFNFGSSLGLSDLVSTLAALLEQPVVDEDGNLVLDEQGNPVTVPVMRLGELVGGLLDAESLAAEFDLGPLESLLFLLGYSSMVEVLEDVLGDITAYDNATFLALLGDGLDAYAEAPPAAYTVTGDIRLPIFPAQGMSYALSSRHSSELESRRLPRDRVLGR